MPSKCCKPFPRGTILVLLMSSLLYTVHWFLYYSITVTLPGHYQFIIVYVHPACYILLPVTGWLGESWLSEPVSCFDNGPPVPQVVGHSQQNWQSHQADFSSSKLYSKEQISSTSQCIDIHWWGAPFTYWLWEAQVWGTIHRRRGGGCQDSIIIIVSHHC